MHVLLSFIEHPNPFPNHAITDRIVTIHLTDLVTNLTWCTFLALKKNELETVFHSRRPLQLS